jgi:hypothetical protein
VILESLEKLGVADYSVRTSSKATVFYTTIHPTGAGHGICGYAKTDCKQYRNVRIL